MAGVNWIFCFVRRFIQKEDNYSAGSVELPWRQSSQGYVAAGRQDFSEERQHREKHGADSQADARSFVLCTGKVNVNLETISEEEKETLS